MRSLTVYTLKLANDKYYVGKSRNIVARMKRHFSGNGSEWTKKHKPIEKPPKEVAKKKAIAKNPKALRPSKTLKEKPRSNMLL